MTMDRVISYVLVTTTRVISYNLVTTNRVISYDPVASTRVISYNPVMSTRVVSYDLMTTLTDGSKLHSPSFHWGTSLTVVLMFYIRHPYKAYQILRDPKNKNVSQYFPTMRISTTTASPPAWQIPSQHRVRCDRPHRNTMCNHPVAWFSQISCIFREIALFLQCEFCYKAAITTSRREDGNLGSESDF